MVGALSFALFLGFGVMQGFGVFVETWEDEFGVSVGTISIAAAPLGGDMARRYLESVPMTIAAGTSEIQRNIIAERGLGLPRP